MFSKGNENKHKCMATAYARQCFRNKISRSERRTYIHDLHSHEALHTECERDNESNVPSSTNESRIFNQMWNLFI